MKKRVKLLIIIAMMLTYLSGCENKRATICTTVYPVKYIIEQLAGNKVDVEYITEDVFIQRAGMVDNYKSILEKTTLFVYIGELEPYMDLYETDIQGYSFDIINLAQLSAIDKFKRYTTSVTETGMRVVTESEYYPESEFDLVDVYNKDPFIWLDPIAMSSIASTIKSWLIEKYPEDTLYYENSFKALQADLVRMDVEFRALISLDNVRIATIGATFGNWQKTYGVEVYPIVLSKYGALPDDKQLAIIKQTMLNNGVEYIAWDDTLPQEFLDLAETVAEDLNLTKIRISSLSRLSDNDKAKNKDYMTIMYENLNALETVFKQNTEE
ncbi:MAG: zinc ABC transporter substrate-binding protein [Erysipelotrichaceae bacterium]|nr:zinc ABC transporter substrate-binding protein [Erysipelotrichaceae bacterium]